MMAFRQLDKRRVILLFSIMLIVVSGYGMILPVLPYYAQGLGATPTHLGFLIASYPLMQFIFSPVWGVVSDQVGRRPVILSGLLGFAFAFGIMGVGKSLWVLFLARILGGILSSATIPSAYAYMADITDLGTRGRGMSWMSASAMVGIFLGPAIGGFLGDIQLNYPFFAAAALALAFAGVSFLLLPESIRTPARYSSPSGEHRPALKNPFFRLDHLFTQVGLILLLTFLVAFASGNLEGTLGLMVEASLGYGAKETGLIFTVAGLVLMIMQGFVAGGLIDRFGETPLITAGLAASVIGYFLLPHARHLSDLLWIMGAMSVFTAGMRPAITTWLSKSVTESEQGSILGENTRYMSLGRVVGPITGGSLFTAFGYQSPYLLAASIFLIALLYTLVIANRREKFAQSELN
jgi:multidrug resistance protein